jgi:hypothetical protein
VNDIKHAGTPGTEANDKAVIELKEKINQLCLGVNFGIVVVALVEMVMHYSMNPDCAREARAYAANILIDAADTIMQAPLPPAKPKTDG